MDKKARMNNMTGYAVGGDSSAWREYIEGSIQEMMYGSMGSQYITMPDISPSMGDVMNKKNSIVNRMVTPISENLVDILEYR